jgi:hypothetical protein
LRAKIAAAKAVKDVDVLGGWWDEQLAKLAKMGPAEKATHMYLLARSPKAAEGWLAPAMRVYRLALEITAWTAEPEPERADVRDAYTSRLLRGVKAAYEMPTLPGAALGALASVLISLGLGDYVPAFEAPFEADPARVDAARDLGFEFPKLIKKSGSVVNKFMRMKVSLMQIEDAWYSSLCA